MGLHKCQRDATVTESLSFLGNFGMFQIFANWHRSCPANFWMEALAWRVDISDISIASEMGLPSQAMAHSAPTRTTTIKIGGSLGTNLVAAAVEEMLHTHSKACNNCGPILPHSVHQIETELPPKPCYVLPEWHALEISTEGNTILQLFSLPPWTSFLPWRPAVAVMHRQGRFTEWPEHDRWPSQLERSGCRWQERRGERDWLLEVQTKAGLCWVCSWNGFDSPKCCCYVRVCSHGHLFRV